MALKNNFFLFDPEYDSNTPANKEQLLQNKIEMMNFVLDQCEEILFVIDVNTNIIFSNERASESLGYPHEELLNMQIVDVAPNFREEVLLQIPNAGIQQQGSTTMEMIFKTKDHQSLQVEVKISPFISSQCYFSIVAKDITVHTQLYDLLIHNENEFGAFIENSNDIIIRYDMSFRCIYVNKTFEKITGYSRLDLVEKYYWDTGILLENHIQLLKNRLAMVVQSGEPTSFEFILSHATSKLPLHLEVNIMPEYDIDDEMCGFIIVSHDISKLKYKENELIISKDRADESSKMKSFFLAIISHEIRTPLNAIIGFSQLLNDETLAQEDRDEFIALIEKSGMQLIHNVEDILELSKIASGQLVLNLQNYHPNAIIQEKYSEIGKMLKEYKKQLIDVKFTCLNLSQDGLSFYSDTKLIRQVLSILTNNAVKYTKNGQIELGVKLSDHDKILFYVSDTGIGVPKEKHESIFEPFVQVDLSMIRSYEGLGIGLTLARRIARALGGDLTIDSAPGKGSTFSFLLPMVHTSE